MKETREHRSAATLDYAKPERPDPPISRCRFGVIGLALSSSVFLLLLTFRLVNSGGFRIDMHHGGNAILQWSVVPSLIALCFSFFGVAQHPRSGVPYIGIALALLNMMVAPSLMCA